MSETNKYYCVRSYGAGGYVTQGKIYEFNDCMTYDDGVKGYRFKTWENYSNSNPGIAACLVPLVQRSAKVGEWVYITGFTQYHYSDVAVGGIYKVGQVYGDNGELIGVESGSGFEPREYLVLDNYNPNQPKGEPTMTLEQQREATEPERNQQHKYDATKPRLELVPPSLMIEVGKVLTYGAAKYAPNSWRNVAADRYVGAMLRHMMAWQQGEDNDAESGLPHLSHAACNIAFLIELSKPITVQPIFATPEHEPDIYSYDGEDSQL